VVVLEAIIVWSAIVVATMLAVAYLAPRWGRDPFGWLLLSAVMGPIALVGLVGTRHSDVERAKSPQPARARSENDHCVLIAVDGSAAGVAAARHVAELSDEVGEAAVLAVLPHEAQPRTAGPSRDEYAERVQRITGPALDALRAANVPARVIVAFGVPGEEIVRAAERESVDVVVVGRRGAGLSRALLGSTSDYVLRHAKQPVTVVS
jgi:nucleotide-binding universal stress UspA family protein